jgi:uncharacterized protein (DUF58 family)
MVAAAALPNAGVRVELAELIALRAQAGALNLVPRRRTGALRAGNERSPFRGRGMEFDESRIYQPGDDVRQMDWRVTARSGRPHVKLFREERERPVWLAVDQAASMHFGTRTAFKAVVAARAAALLAWAAAERGDRVGGLVFSAAGHRELRPAARRRGVLALLQALCEAAAAPTAAPASAALDPALARLVRLARPGSLVFLLSDFAALSDAGAALLARLAEHCELVLALIYDPVEAELPPPGRYPVSDGHALAILDTRDPALRAAHRARFQARRERLLQLSRRYRMHFVPLATDLPLATTLSQALARRAGGAPR